MPKSIEDVLELCKAGEALKLPFFLEEILVDIKNRIGCEAGSILLLNEETGKLEFKVTEGAKSSEIKKLCVDPNEGVAGWVFRKSEPLVVNSTESDNRFSHRFDDSTGYSTKCVLAAPIKVGEKVVGIFELLNKGNGRFSQEDIGIALSYASIASVVIENIELYKNLRLLVQRLRNLENYQTALLESLTDGVLSVDSESRIVSCNSSVLSMISKSMKDVIGKHISEFIESEKSIEEIINESRLKGKVSDVLCYIKKSGKGRVPVALDASILRTEGEGKGLVVVIRNLRSALDHEEIKREVILKSDLATNLSHEFNTPLTSIHAGLQLLKRNSNGNSKYVDIVYNNVKVLQGRIQLFLDYLKAEKDEWDVCFEKIHLNEVLKSIISEFRERYPGYKFRLCLPGNRIYINADQKQLQRILGEIIKNAIQYSKVGNRIRVITTENGKFVYLFITDQGSGISPENVNLLFQKFKRFSNSINETTSGMGIGLWLVKYLVEKNNAQIAVKSKEGEGTIVKLSFSKIKEHICSVNSPQ